jgi:LacI family transcriptional regulator
MATIKDVARKSGVSTATVSHVINGTRIVSASTREAVMQAMQELDYSPSVYGRALRTRTLRQIGYVVADLTNPFFAAVFSGVEKLALKHGYTVIVSHSGENAALESEVVSGLIARGVDGLIIAPVAYSRLCEVALAVPVVFIDRNCSSNRIASVTTEMDGAIQQAVTALHLAGFQDIGFLAGRAGLSTTDHRRNAYGHVMQTLGLDHHVYEGDSRMQSGREAVDWARTLTVPFGMICGNNLMAMGFVQELLQRHMMVQYGTGIVVIDDEVWTTFTTPAVSVIAQPTIEIGMSSMQLLLAAIENSENKSAVNESVRLPCHFEVRGVLATTMMEVRTNG